MDTAFFVVSKLGWALVRPGMLILLTLALGTVLLWRRRMRAGRALVSAAFVTLAVVTLTPLADVLLRQIETRHPIPALSGPVAGILVLGGGGNPSGLAQRGLPTAKDAGDRVLAALELAHRIPDAPVMCIGGSGRIFPGEVREADVARRFLTGNGLDPSRLILEGASRNTAENARLGRALAPDGAGQWLLVTSAAHMPRSVATFCAAGWRGLTPYPVDFRSDVQWRSGLDPVQSLRTFNVAVREMLGLAVYRATGRAVSALPTGCLWAQ